MAATRTPAKTSGTVWSEEERAAMQASVRERKSSAGLSPEAERAQGEQDVRDSIAKLPPDERAMAERIHELVTLAAPSLRPKTYYGMPGYAQEGKNGRSICFFKPKSKFRVRYSTLGFQPDANLDEGAMWPTEFAVIELTPAVEARITGLVKRAVS